MEMEEEKLDTKATPFQRDRSGPVCVTRPLIIQGEPKDCAPEMEDQLPSAVVNKSIRMACLSDTSKGYIPMTYLFEYHKHSFFFLTRGDTNIGH